MSILERIEVLCGDPAEFKADSSPTLLATMPPVRNGAPAHFPR